MGNAAIHMEMDRITPDNAALSKLIELHPLHLKLGEPLARHGGAAIVVAGQDGEVIDAAGKRGGRSLQAMTMLRVSSATMARVSM